MTVKVAVCPAASVNGKAGPVKVKPAPEIVACEMETEAALAVTVTVCEGLVPMVTLPKLSDEALADNCADEALFVTHMLMDTELEALLTRESTPVW